MRTLPVALAVAAAGARSSAQLVTTAGMITADTAPVLFILTYLIVVQMAVGFLTPSTVVTEGETFPFVL